MKEFTIEEKAARYDAALVWMRDLYPTMDGAMKEDMEHYFPELKASDDEKIRKWLITFFKDEYGTNCNARFAGIKVKDILAWLERQGEHDMGISEATKQELEDNLNKTLEKETPESYNEFLDWQEYAEKTEPKFNVGDHIKPIDKCLGSSRIIEEVCDGLYVTDKGTLYFEFEDNWELVEKPAWSEEDERLRISCIKHIEEELREIRNDKYGHSEIISDLKESCRERITWLKSLKERYTWKPSDEQIEALEHFVRSVGESGYASPYDNNTKLLYSLLEQLKKLKI